MGQLLQLILHNRYTLIYTVFILSYTSLYMSTSFLEQPWKIKIKCYITRIQVPQTHELVTQ